MAPGLMQQGPGGVPPHCHMSHCPMLPFLSMSASPAASTMAPVSAVTGCTLGLAGGSTVTRMRQEPCCVTCAQACGRGDVSAEMGVGGG